MEAGNIIAIATAVVGIVGALLASIINYMSIRSTTRNEVARIRLEEKRTETDVELTSASAATQMLSIGLQQITLLQSVYSECMQQKCNLEDEISALKVKLLGMRMAMFAVSSEIDSIVEDAIMCGSLDIADKDIEILLVEKVKDKINELAQKLKEEAGK